MSRNKTALRHSHTVPGFLCPAFAESWTCLRNHGLRSLHHVYFNMNTQGPLLKKIKTKASKPTPPPKINTPQKLKTLKSFRMRVDESTNMKPLDTFT